MDIETLSYSPAISLGVSVPSHLCQDIILGIVTTHIFIEKEVLHRVRR